MNEILNNQKSPEERIFGDAFRIIGGLADRETVDRFFTERLEMIQTGNSSTWLPWNLDPEADGFAASYYLCGQVVITIECDLQTLLADIYNAKSGVIIHQGVSFSQAVDLSESLADQI